MKEIWMVEWSDYSFARNGAFSSREAAVKYIENIGKNLRNFQRVTLDLDDINDGADKDECQFGYEYTIYEFERAECDYHTMTYKYVVEDVRLTRYVIDDLVEEI